MAMVAAGASMDEEEVRRLKRDAAIRQKELDYHRKRKEEEANKKVELERMKQQAIDDELRKQKEKLDHWKKESQIRAARKAEQQRMDAKRLERINAREAAWKKGADAEIAKLLQDQEEYEEAVAEKHADARARKAKHEQELREEKINQFIAEEEREEKRTDAIEVKNQKRTIRDALRTDNIKEEASEELLSFIQNPFPIPLKQVVCGRIRPVPTVTELLAAYKDAKEELEEVSEQDFEMRAVLRNQTLFQYVYDVQKKAEDRRIHPPEPLATDLVKKKTKSASRSASPTNAARTTGGFRKRG
eukprot:TRINITY_DN73271_c0_g1_i1.p1 TRINITY_DN73271_c0_g1~~TRINITY_DN73271_c0_g1_i1.p1  ORF type:complete len:339 (+),score=110.36 TRINITY_DN73271_c0_g1_i1:112-1017(+)